MRSFCINKNGGDDVTKNDSVVVRANWGICVCVLYRRGGVAATASISNKAGRLLFVHLVLSSATGWGFFFLCDGDNEFWCIEFFSVFFLCVWTRFGTQTNTQGSVLDLCSTLSSLYYFFFHSYFLIKSLCLKSISVLCTGVLSGKYCRPTFPRKLRRFKFPFFPFFSLLSTATIETEILNDYRLRVGSSMHYLVNCYVKELHHPHLFCFFFFPK